MFTMKVIWVDVGHGSPQPPAFLLEREPLGEGPTAWGGQTQRARDGTYWVPQGDVLADEPAPWAMTRTGEHVRVPIVRYTLKAAMASLFGLGLQIGARAVHSLRQHAGAEPVELILILGSRVGQDVGPDGGLFRAYAGLAIRTE